MKALFLFDTTGYAAAPFTAAGWETYIIDTLNVGERTTNKNATHVLDWDILKKETEIAELAKGAMFIFGFPPCTDLASVGASVWNLKKLDNPDFQLDAIHLVRSVERIGDKANVAWALENPIGRISKFWRRFDFWFNPCDYGGYLPENDQHPDWPNYIIARDAYEKKTCVWHSFDFIRPPKRSIMSTHIGWAPQWGKLGGRGKDKEKDTIVKLIRSASPRGFFQALYEAYSE